MRAISRFANELYEKAEVKTIVTSSSKKKAERLYDKIIETYKIILVL